MEIKILYKLPQQLSQEIKRLDIPNYEEENWIEWRELEDWTKLQRVLKKTSEAKSVLKELTKELKWAPIL